MTKLFDILCDIIENEIPSFNEYKKEAEDISENYRQILNQEYYTEADTSNSNNVYGLLSDLYKLASTKGDSISTDDVNKIIRSRSDELSTASEKAIRNIKNGVGDNNVGLSDEERTQKIDKIESFIKSLEITKDPEGNESLNGPIDILTTNLDKMDADLISKFERENENLSHGSFIETMQVYSKLQKEADGKIEGFLNKLMTQVAAKENQSGQEGFDSEEDSSKEEFDSENKSDEEVAKIFFDSPKFIKARQEFYKIMQNNTKAVDSALLQNREDLGTNSIVFKNFDLEDAVMNVERNAVGILAIGALLKFIDKLDGTTSSKQQRFLQNVLKVEDALTIDEELASVYYNELYNPIRAKKAKNIKENEIMSFDRLTKSEEAFIELMKNYFKPTTLNYFKDKAKEIGSPFNLDVLQELELVKDSNDLEDAKFSAKQILGHSNISQIIQKLNEHHGAKKTKSAEKKTEKKAKEDEKQTAKEKADILARHGI